MNKHCISYRSFVPGFHCNHRRFAVAVLLAACLLGASPVYVHAKERKDAADAVERIRHTVELLADDDMQGRGLGTNGLNRAAGYIGQQFIQMKLKTNMCDGGLFQTFTVRTKSENRQHQIDWLSALQQAGILDKPDKKNDKKKADGETETKTPGNSNPPGNKPPKTKARKAKIKNVIAVLEGRGPQLEETIIIGAHYDHLGQRRGADGELIVFNGANDNASGTAALLEVARILSQRKERLPRRIVFVAFSGEELGLMGSLFYVDNPPIPLANTIAMINLDMVGCLRDDTIVAMGTGSSPSLAALAKQTSGRHGISLLPVPFSMPCSDHAPFHAHRVPVIFFSTTGGMIDYHQPSDTAEKLNYEGIHRIARMTSDLAVTLAQTEDRPKFVNEGLPATLLRGAVRIFGRSARAMATEPEKSEKTAPTNRNNRTPLPDGPSKPGNPDR